MPSDLISPVQGTGILSPERHHQYVIEGYAAPNSIQSNVSATSDLSESATPRLIQSNIGPSFDLLEGTITSQPPQHSVKVPSTPLLSSSKQFARFFSASEKNAVLKVLSTIPLSSKRGGDIGSNKQQQTCQPTSALDAESLTTSTLGENFGPNKIGHSDLALTFTPVKYAFSAASPPTLISIIQQNFKAQQLAPNEQQRHSELSNFAIVNLASENSMDSVSSSRFPAEVEVFTQSYQFAPILPTFSRTPLHSPSDASKLAVSNQLPSDFLNVVNDGHLSSYDTEIEDVSSSTDVETPLSALESLVGLGISFGQLTSGSLTTSPTQTLHTSFRRVTPSSLETGGVVGSPSPFTTTQSSNTDFSPKDQQKSRQLINLSNLNTGFTPLNEQVRVSHGTEGSPVKKIRLSINAATPVLPATANFGPPLHSSNIQKQGSPSQISNYARATTKSLLQRSYTGSNKAGFLFLAFDQQHVEILLKELEKWSAEDLEGVEIRMVNYHEGSTATQQAKLKERLSGDQKQKLITFTRANCGTMKQSKMPEDPRLVKFMPLYQPGRPRPVIKLRVLPPPLTEFHLFNKLPPELQQRIWKFSLPGPRTIFLTSPKGRSGLEIFQPKSRPPAILQVCAQSRAVALRILQPAFENPVHLRGAYTFFDFEIDSLRVTSGVSIETARAVACAKNPSIVRDRERVRHLEIPFHIGHNMQQYQSLAALIILAPKRGWPALETLTFPGCPVHCRGDKETYRMPIIEVKKNAKIEGLMEHISTEFRAVWEEFKDKFEKMPNTGLKIVYSDEDLE
ncbi:hypothetical protein N431DRAFT_553610 [Stipitochalara longipes BDJ]|nr:hypothetical protein N431DRAFT_553610 [Stipitochalara longipes BDJ]